TFSGGAPLQLVNSETKAIVNIELVPPYKAQIPYGTCDMHLIGCEGEKDWDGPHLCGGLKAINFAEPEKIITITVHEENCTPVPYSTIIASKSPTSAFWGISKWNGAKWGP